jgi:hypothetical protein
VTKRSVYSAKGANLIGTHTSEKGRMDTVSAAYMRGSTLLELYFMPSAIGILKGFAKDVSIIDALG